VEDRFDAEVVLVRGCELVAALMRALVGTGRDSGW
jgi:hypothetical protein